MINLLEFLLLVFFSNLSVMLTSSKDLIMLTADNPLLVPSGEVNNVGERTGAARNYYGISPQSVTQFPIHSSIGMTYVADTTP